jgi:hypothetical protein
MVCSPAWPRGRHAETPTASRDGGGRAQGFSGRIRAGPIEPRDSPIAGSGFLSIHSVLNLCELCMVLVSFLLKARVFPNALTDGPKWHQGLWALARLGVILVLSAGFEELVRPRRAPEIFESVACILFCLV